jgi:hypothetical protein
LIFTTHLKELYTIRSLIVNNILPQVIIGEASAARLLLLIDMNRVLNICRLYFSVSNDNKISSFSHLLDLQRTSYDPPTLIT